jgi:hypothetical protein
VKFHETNQKRLKAAVRAGLADKPKFESQAIPPAKVYELMTHDECIFGGDRTFVFDVESYANYFCVSFQCDITEKVITFEDSDYGYKINNEEVTQELWCQWLSWILFRFTIVGFNSRPYDLPICLVAVKGVRAPMLCQITDDIINNDMPPFEVERKYVGKIPTLNHIDLIEVAPLQGSLKLYGARLHVPRLQDLPFPPLSTLALWQMSVVKDYNINDLEDTLWLWRHIKPQIDLRVQLGQEYGVDLRSRSDAQIAETVIGSELQKLGVKTKAPDSLDYAPGQQFYYKVPETIWFKTGQFQKVLEVVRTSPFIIGNSGYCDCPKAIEQLKPRLNGCVYRLGAGGLHSSEKSVAYEADENTLLIDRDVSSYYPYIILNQRLFPHHLGEAFLKVFEGIVNRRINAKREGRKKEADSLKITINGTFGKLGNPFSILYSPELLMQVTISGQLYLLMLIERIELAGIPVISANTDGVVIKCPKDKYKDLEAVITVWEEDTGFITEETRYKGLYCRDVNNYIAVKEEGGCKMKGVYAEVGSALNSPLSKNPEAHIVSMALQAFLEHGTPIEQTVELFGNNVEQEYYPTPISRFVLVRNVKGGGEKNGTYLGKVVRWYYAKDEKGAINSVLSGNKVALTDGGKPCMIMPTGFPDDIDFDRYISDANEELYNIGVLKRLSTGQLFEA